jgi:hypothetical protein
MGCIFSKEPNNVKSTTGTSGLDSPLLGGNFERLDVQPTQPVSTSKPQDPAIQAELDNRKKEREEEKKLRLQERALLFQEFQKKREAEKEALRIKAQQSAAKVAADAVERAATAAQRNAEVEKRNNERAANKQAPKSAK